MLLSAPPLSFCPAPFFILDEVDAALDNSNIGKARLQTGAFDSGLRLLLIWRPCFGCR